jgi:hypothetical protein
MLARNNSRDTIEGAIFLHHKSPGGRERREREREHEGYYGEIDLRVCYNKEGKD